MYSNIENMRKSRTLGGHIEIIGFAELFETNIFIYDLVTDLEPRYKMENSNSFNTVWFMYRNNDHYNLLTKKNTELKDIRVPKMTKLMIKLMAKNKKAWTITESPKNNDFVNEEEIVTAEKNEAIMEYWLSDDKKPVYPQKLWNLKMTKSRKKSVTSEI